MEHGELLGKKLGIPCYEKEILKMASDRSGINEALFARNDEKIKGSYLWNLMTKIQTATVVGPQDRHFVSNDNIFNIQRQIIQDLADHTSCIIVGKCANYILKDRTNVISVYIEAPRESCEQRIMDKYLVDKEKADQMIKETDKYRYDYYKYYTHGEDWRNPDRKSTRLNSSHL